MANLLFLLPSELLLNEVGRWIDIDSKIRLAEYRLLPSPDLSIEMLLVHWHDLSFTERRLKFLKVAWVNKRMAIFIAEMALQRPALFDLYGMNRLAAHMVHRGLPHYQTLLKERWESHSGQKVNTPWVTVQTADFKIIGSLISSISAVKIKKTQGLIERLERRFYCCSEEIEHRLNQIDRRLADRLNEQTDEFSLKRKAQNRLWFNLYRYDQIMIDGEIDTPMAPLTGHIDEEKELWRWDSNEGRHLGLLSTAGAMKRLLRHRYMFYNSPASFLLTKFSQKQCRELYQYAQRRGLDEWTKALSSSMKG